MMRIAVIVMTYNRADALVAVLRGVAPQLGARDLLVVADDGSRPEQVAWVRERLPACACPVVHVWHPDVGFTLARSRNLGAAAAMSRGCDYIIFLDGDCVPAPHFLAAHRALAQAGHFVTGSRVLLSQGLSARVVGGQCEPGRLARREWVRHWLRGDANKLTHLTPWLGVPGRRKRRFVWKGIRGCNMAMWARDYQAVNGCDESFSGWGHEDADLVLRLHNQGLVRKNGHLATEVFHLWHPENSRADEARNRERVTRRLQAGLQRAERGLDEARLATDMSVTEWSPGQGQEASPIP